METIDLNNYEEYLLDYADGELEPAREAELLKFLEAYPALRQELALLEAARLQPDEKVVFPDKSPLYREARRLGVIRSGWWIAAAAAVAVLMMIFYRPSRQTAVYDGLHHTVAATAPAPAGSLPAVAPSSSRPAGISGDTALARLLPAAAPAPGGKTSASRTPAAVKKTAAGVAERKPVADRLPETAAPEPALVTLRPLQRPAVPEGRQPPLAPASAPDMPVPGPVVAHGKENPRLPDHTRSFTDSAGMTTVRTEVAALAGAKERLDDRITDKITGLQDRLSHPFRGMAGKKIRIGHLQIAMSN